MAIESDKSKNKNNSNKNPKTSLKHRYLYACHGYLIMSTNKIEQLKNKMLDLQTTLLLEFAMHATNAYEVIVKNEALIHEAYESQDLVLIEKIDLKLLNLNSKF